MGDRGNIIIRDEGAPDLYLYTHWNGSDLPKTLKRALSRKERWEDSAYLARIIFCEMVKGSEADATGFGILDRGDGRRSRTGRQRTGADRREEGRQDEVLRGVRRQAQTRHRGAGASARRRQPTAARQVAPKKVGVRAGLSLRAIY